MALDPHRPRGRVRADDPARDRVLWAESGMMPGMDNATARARRLLERTNPETTDQLIAQAQVWAVIGLTEALERDVEADAAQLVLDEESERVAFGGIPFTGPRGVVRREG